MRRSGRVLGNVYLVSLEPGMSFPLLPLLRVLPPVRSSHDGHRSPAHYRQGARGCTALAGRRRRGRRLARADPGRLSGTRKCVLGICIPGPIRPEATEPRTRNYSEAREQLLSAGPIRPEAAQPSLGARRRHRSDRVLGNVSQSLVFGNTRRLGPGAIALRPRELPRLEILGGKGAIA
jgi:hypothetical protein